MEAEHSYKDIKDLTFDELALLLYVESKTTHFGSNEPDEEDKKFIGKEIFLEIVENLKPHICKKTISEPINSKELEIASVIADVGLSIVGKIPVTLLSVMIVKYGLEKICGHCKNL